MSLVKNITSSVPENVRNTQEFRVFVAIIRQKDLRSIIGIKAYVDSEIKNCQDWINANKTANTSGTKNRWLSAHASHLDFLRTVKSKILKYL